MTFSAQIPSTNRSAWSSVDVTPTGVALGAEVSGVDLRDLDDAAFGRLMQAWHQHSVVLVPEVPARATRHIPSSSRLAQASKDDSPDLPRIKLPRATLHARFASCHIIDSCFSGS